jgi:choline-sulfatase
MSEKRPNILLITGDEWRADALGCAGNAHVRTPNIDALADQGVRFTNGYAPAPMCVPSRFSLLTGQVARTHGCASNGFTPTDNRTFVEQLRENGYQTGAFGKMHFVPIYLDLGFDEMQMAEQHGAGWQIDDYHRWLWEEHGMVDWIDLWDQAAGFRETAPEWFHKSYGIVKSPIPEEAYHTSWITDRFIDWTDNQDADEPWMGWVSYIKPHHPFDPPGHYADMYDPADMPLPPRDDAASHPLMSGFDPKRTHFDISEWTDDDIRRMTAYYYGTITHIDDSIGRIIESLRASGQADNTVVIITSDHGDFLGHRGLITKAPFILYEDTTRVPFIIADLRKEEASRTSDAFVNLLDIFPTVMNLTGVENDHRIHGNDLTPILTGEANEVTDVAVSETEGSIAIRKGSWKLIQNRRGVSELYNLDEDPSEHTNRFPDMEASEIVTNLRAAALEYVLQTSWDRCVLGADGVQRIIIDEADAKGKVPLEVEPTAWRDMWPSEFTPDV